MRERKEKGAWSLLKCYAAFWRGPRAGHGGGDDAVCHQPHHDLRLLVACVPRRGPPGATAPV